MAPEHRVSTPEPERVHDIDLTAAEVLAMEPEERPTPEQLWEAASARAGECKDFNALTRQLVPPRGVAPGILHGIPVVVKANIDVEGVPTTAGTPALTDNFAPVDAPIITRLRNAGAQIFGITVMHELALGATSNNAFDGAPRNPWNPSVISGGSSGGSASAVALGIAPIGIGTDTGGSVRMPAALCGLYGFRPTVGRYPGTSIFSLSPTRDTAGPIARTMDDIVLVDRVLAGKEQPLPPAAPASGVIAVSTSHLDDLDDDVAERFEHSLAALAEAGYSFVDIDLSNVAAASVEIAFDLVWGEAVTSLTDYLESRGGPSLDEVFAGIASPDVREIVRASAGAVSQKRYHQVISTLLKLRTRFAAAMNAVGADVVMFPTTPAVAPPIGADATMLHNGVERETFATMIRHSDLGGTLGLPGISVPVGAGTLSGLPVGVEFTAQRWADEKLLAMTRRIAEVIGVTARPTEIVPTVAAS